MNRKLVIVILVVLVLAASVFGGVWYAAEQEGAGEVAVAAAAAGPAPVAPAGDASPARPATHASPLRAASAADVTRWTAEVNNADPGTRAAAIRALANAPRAEALPVLHGVLIHGEPQVDRPLALNSLRELALDQGDADGKVREAIREAIYHNDDQNPTLLADAQEALDVVEESELR